LVLTAPASEHTSNRSPSTGRWTYVANRRATRRMTPRSEFDTNVCPVRVANTDGLERSRRQIWATGRRYRGDLEKCDDEERP
jgi:hypothetical protein